MLLATCALIGGIAGGIVGSSVGLVTAGIGMVATVPAAVGGAGIGHTVCYYGEKGFKQVKELVEKK